MTAHCPTCGGPVKVGGKGTTHYYVSSYFAVANALRDLVAWFDGRSEGFRKRSSKYVWDNARAALDAVEAEREERDEQV